MVRTTSLLRRLMGPYFERHGISSAQWAVLRALERAESRGFRHLRATELSNWLLVRPPSITNIVARLRRAGYIRQQVNPDDHRVKQLSLTANGRRLVSDVLAGHVERIDFVLSPLDDPARSQLASLLERVADHLEQLTDADDAPMASSAGSESADLPDPGT